jgi:hypothetical protein
VVDYEIGPGGGFQEHLLPDVVLGGPRGGGLQQGSDDVFSLGAGGSITLEFVESVVVDGPGPDLIVFENAFLTAAGPTLGPPFAESARVEVSADGRDFVPFPCAMDDRINHFPGCAGVFPVLSDVDDPGSPPATVPSTVPITALIGLRVPVDPPAGSGGDSFDLTDIGVRAIRFVRIVSGPGALPNGEGKAGFDLDAVAAVNREIATDDDADSVVDALDNCPTVANTNQADGDADGLGDPCDLCPADHDPTNADADGDGIGDACAPGPPPDADRDGIADGEDNCPQRANRDQHDADRDAIGDACDSCPAAADPEGTDRDGDGLGDVCDLCPAIADPTNRDTDGDGIGDVCEPPDADGDGIADAADGCPHVPDPLQPDGDGDGLGDACDLCPAVASATNADTDGDALGDECDPCPDDARCGLLRPAVFHGGRPTRAAERFITFVEPAAKVTTVARDAVATTLWINFGPTVDPSTLRAKLGRKDVTAFLAPAVPASSVRLTLPLERRRTRLVIRIRGTKDNGRRARDVDTLIFRKRRR